MELIAQKRDKFGKALRSFKKEGLIPAEVYGRGFENKHISVGSKDFHKVFAAVGENAIFDLKLEKESWPVLVYDIKKDPLTGDVTHVDFYRVTMTEKIKAKVPIEFIGEAPAVKEKLGILNKAITEVEVEALPAKLPHKIEVDLSSLVDLDSNIYAKDLKLEKEVKIVLDPETVVVSVVPIKEEEPAPVPIDVSAVKVEGEEKRAEKEAKEETEEKSQG